MCKARTPFQPDPAQLALWPSVSGNAINGPGEDAPARPKPIYWHDPDRTPHGPLQRWFSARSADEPSLKSARAERQKILDLPLSEIATKQVESSPLDWSNKIKASALEAGADIVGIAEIQPEWVFDGYEVTQRWIVMIGVAHEYERMKLAPESGAAAEVVRQYTHGNRVAKHLASVIREHGYDALPHGGPMAGPVVLIPPALACGFGELGKHGSIINRKLGSSFRLASVLIDLPLAADKADRFGADEFCIHCRVCVDACPPDAIFKLKQTVRGRSKWYVDFDKCLPYFNETMGCGICVAVCPWSHPELTSSLVDKISARVLGQG